jgi:outer membrane murein-binding lipoprotein Lpp
MSGVELVLGWPAAVAVVSSVVAVVIGIVKFMVSGRSNVTIDTVYAEQRAMSARVQELEVDVARLNTSVDAIRKQLDNARDDMAQLSRRIDVLLEKGSR